MTYIGIDTNIWIYLTNSNLTGLWDKLNEMKTNGEIEIFINDAILLEWERNKQTTTNNLAKQIREEYLSAKKIADYLPATEKAAYLALISKYQVETERIKQAEKKVAEVEAFMMKKCRNVPVTNEQKLFISDLAIQNKPPFQNKKNNYNDALILRSICEYIVKNNYTMHDLLYVSNNPDDFTDKKTGKVHPELLVGIEQIRITNVTDLSHAFQLAPGLVDEIDEWLEQELDNEAMYQLDIMRGK